MRRAYIVGIRTTTGRIDLIFRAENTTKLGAIEAAEKQIEKHEDWIEVIGVR